MVKRGNEMSAILTTRQQCCQSGAYTHMHGDRRFTDLVHFYLTENTSGQKRFNLLIYEGVSKSSRKSAIIFLFCKSGELN